MIARLSAFEIEHFKLIWACILVVVACAGVGYATLLDDGARQPGPKLLPSLSTGERVLFAILLAVFASYVALTLVGEDFAGYDDTIFTSFSIRGINHRPPIWPSEGRFFPLGHQEFNYLRLITRSLTGYHTFALFELALLSCGMFLALDGLAVPARFGLIALSWVTPSLLIAFTGLIYVERNVVVFLVVFLVAVQRYAKSRSVLSCVSALLAAQAALYMKEVAFVVVLAFAGARIGLGWLRLRAEPASGRAPRLLRAHGLDFMLLGLVAIYLALLGLALLPSGGSGYAAKMRNPNDGVLSIFLHYVELDLLLLVFALVFLVRAARLISTRREPDSVWDPLALGALGYAAAVVALRMFAAYYMAPVDCIALLYLGWLASRSEAPRWAAAVVGLIVVQDVAYSFFRVIEQKNTLAGKIELARFLDAQPKGRAVRLFFPYARPYRMMELAGFLSYKGLPVGSDDPSDRRGPPTITLSGPDDFPNGRCVDYRPFLCTRSERPEPGALIVILPDDVVPAGAAEALAARYPVADSRSPFGAPSAARPIFSLLRRVSDTFVELPLPSTWLKLQVFAVH